MQNIFVQIAVGLLPITLFFIISAVIAKKHKFRNVIFAVFFVVVIGVLMFRRSGSYITEDGVLEHQDRLSLMYAVADEGSVDLARDFLQDESKSYQPEYALAAARFAAYGKDYTLAKALYMKAVQSFPEAAEELSQISELCEAEADYFGVTDDSDLSKIYKTRERLGSSTVQNIRKSMKSSVLGSKNDLFKKIAEYVVFADEAYQNYLYGENFDLSKTQSKLKRLNKFLEENPEFEKITQVRLARLKLQLLCEEYKAIAASVSQDSDYNELLIVSELYLRDYINLSNFSGDFSKKNMEKYQAVYDKLNQIYKQYYTDKEGEERNIAKEQLNELKEIIKNPALGQIQDGLLDYANEEYAVDASKAYLQMAKIEHSLGHDDKSMKYIDRSMETVGNCEDYAYTAPMHELLEIITTKELQQRDENRSELAEETEIRSDEAIEEMQEGEAVSEEPEDISERLKNTAELVDEVIKNNMTIKIGERNDRVENPESDEIEETDNGVHEAFSSRMQVYVNQKRTSVNIVNVDTDDFEDQGTIRATVNIGNHLYTDIEQLKKAMRITDCGIEITDFKLEKVNYTGANILLCVDKSGSMQGEKIEALKEAIKLFVNDKTEIEKIALVAFDNVISKELPFATSSDELGLEANDIVAGGGTELYNALVASIEKFDLKPGEINSIILMSDGKESTCEPDIHELKEYIGTPCKNKGITVYTIGFGSDVAGGYLNSLASVTGGKYVYASDPTETSRMNQLDEFFKSLRAQILNQYTITFKAKDTLMYNRELRVRIGKSGLDSDRATYSLGSGSDSTVGTTNNMNSPIYMQGKAVCGFSPNLLLKSGKTMTTVLKGEGFEPGDRISVRLKGTVTGMEWNTEPSFVDSKSISFTIPAEAVSDVYDAYISLNGKNTVLVKGLSIFKQGSEHITDFGEYRFVSYIKEKKENSITLSGHVTMNGWLNFNGKVKLIGDLKDESISLVDCFGSYVMYSKENAEGLAKILADLGVPVKMLPFGSVTLYKDSSGENPITDLRVEAFPLNGLDLGKYFNMSQIQMKLYPNRASFEVEKLEVTLPFADQMIEDNDLFSFTKEFGMSVSSQNIGLKVDLGSDDDDNTSGNGGDKNTSLGNLPVKVSMDKWKVYLDTIKNEYEFKFMVKPSFIPGGAVLGLSMKWDNPDVGDSAGKHSNGLVPTEIKLYGDKKFTVWIGKVPITFSDFMLGMEDIDTSKNPLYWTFTGGCDIDVAKIGAIPGLQGLKKWLGDVSILKLDDTSLSLNLGERHAKINTELKLFEEMDFGKVDIELGNFYYTCALLNMENEQVVGLRCRGTFGPDWKFGESTFKLQITGEIDALSKFLGIQGAGEFAAKLKLWIISIHSSAAGEAAIGIRKLSDGSIAFVIKTNPKFPKEIVWPKNMVGRV